MPTALITGASEGLGRALAQALVGRGWRLVVTARHGDRLHAAVEAIRESAASATGTTTSSATHANTITAVTGDVSDEEHRAVLASVVDRLTSGAGLDLLVHNASTLGPTPLRALRHLTASDLQAVLATNVIAPHALTVSLLPALELAGGAVVGISSDAGVEHYDGWGGYGSSKAALDHLMLTLGTEVSGIRGYAFDPGDMRTAMHQAAFPGEDISDRPRPEDVAVPALLALLDRRPPSGRYRAGASS